MFPLSNFNYFYAPTNEFGNFHTKPKSKYRAFGTTKSKYDFDKIKRKRKMSKESSKKNRICKK